MSCGAGGAKAGAIMDYQKVINQAMAGARKAIAAGDALGAVEELVIAFEAMEGCVFDGEGGEGQGE